ncbi:MAG: metallophosphoesterase [Lentimicrobiaceae bacterium]|nr:metallophosphoesterase [Lentimicrobiaceae bacterium]
MAASHDMQNQYRLVWTVTRSVLETQHFKQQRGKGQRKSRWQLFERLLAIFSFLLFLVGLRKRGFLHASHIQLNEVTLTYPDLPTEFHDYRILHLTDLHLDSLPGLEKLIANAIKKIKCDACVLTGDYRLKTHGAYRQILSPMQYIVSAAKVRDGIFATLGNHDTWMMVEPMEAMGIRILANESHFIERNGQKITFTGSDDPHYYYTDQAFQCLESAGDGFKIALVHSPELFDLAAENGYKLYLCGHTHGGQICLPGGKPLIRHLYNGKKYYKGLWQYKQMKGYTSEGCGTSGIPIRFNSHSEVTLFTLKRQ